MLTSETRLAATELSQAQPKQDCEDHALGAEKLRERLARAYYLFARFSMDDQTYTHLSARLPNTRSYWIYPLGMLFEEVTPDRLIEVDFDGNVVTGREDVFNATGYVLHSTIYKSRPDVNAIFHLHTHASCAVSATEEGLLPLSQFAYHFHDRLGYHDYDSLSLDPVDQGEALVESLGSNKHLLLRNHGAVTSGTTIEEAFFYMMFLEKACRVQVLAMPAGRKNLVCPSVEVIQRAREEMTEFENAQIGVRDFDAHCRVTAFPW